MTSLIHYNIVHEGRDFVHGSVHRSYHRSRFLTDGQSLTWQDEEVKSE